MTAATLLAQKPISEVLTIPHDAMVIEAIEKMAKHGVGALIVSDGTRMAGIFSERDYARKGIIQGRKSQSTPVSELMTSKVVKVTDKATVRECMQLMSEKHIRHLPVENEEERVIGVLSVGDIVNAILNDQAVRIKQLEQYMGRRW